MRRRLVAFVGVCVSLAWLVFPVPAIACPGAPDCGSYCQYAVYFRTLDPCDPGDTGCTDVSDADCVAIHEATHVQEWHDFWNTLEDWLSAEGFLDPLPINCADSNTTSCQNAAIFFENKIDGPLYAHMGAKADDIGHPLSGEYRARDAAAPCFYDTGEDICACAISKGWMEEDFCSICDP